MSVQASKPSFGIKLVKNEPIIRKASKKKKADAGAGDRRTSSDIQEREKALNNADDKMSHCVQLLKEGCVQSYGDFFFLTHRPEPSLGKNERLFICPYSLCSTIYYVQFSCLGLILLNRGGGKQTKLVILSL